MKDQKSEIKPWLLEWRGREDEVRMASRVVIGGGVISFYDASGEVFEYLESKGLTRARPISEEALKAWQAKRDAANYREPLAKRLARIPKRPEQGAFPGGWPKGEADFEVLKDMVLTAGVFVYVGERIRGPLWLCEPMTQSAFGRPSLKRIGAAKPEKEAEAA